VQQTKRRAQIAAMVAPYLTDNEELVTASTVWAARVGQVPLLFRGRHLHLLATTGTRLLVFERRRRRRDAALPVVDARLDTLDLQRARARPLLYQVLFGLGDGRRLLFEFRYRDRAAGRAFVRSLRSPREA